MKNSIKLSTFFVGMLLLLAAISPALALSSQITAHGIEGASVNGSSWYSTNWSGYAVTGSTGSVTSVSGSWIVPTVTPVASTPTAYSAFWVGIDGFSSSTVEQTGTLSYTVNGVVQTPYAWYEFYPNAMIQISTGTDAYGNSVPATVKPGDIMSATVNFLSSTTTTSRHHVTVNDLFSVTISDTSAGWTYSTTGTVVNAAMSSAEWIAEAPSSNTGVLPLANFGTVYFGSDSTGVASTCYATIGSNTGNIGSFGLNVQTITMATATYNHRTHSYTYTPEATPSPLSLDGSSFSVTTS
jgi:hypothetical protein